MTERDDNIICLDNVHKRFGRLVVFDDLTLRVGRGKTTVVIGPSGCGKSVLLKHVVGLIRPDKGRILFDGTDITRLPERKLVPFRRRVGFLFQGGALFDSMTVAENVMFPLEEHEVGTPEERRSRADDVLKLVGLNGLQDRYPEELSGGQRKRVALARAISLRPEVILYDEPTTGLDPIRADLINELILKLQAELKTTALVVTHDMNSARKVGDRVVMLHQGKILVDTTPEGLKDAKNDIVAAFVEGRASAEELRELSVGSVGQERQDE
jgi:phospholipid/cholesterol/gamma-HCH transport system ATP-binding protein